MKKVTPEILFLSAFIFCFSCSSDDYAPANESGYGPDAERAYALTNNVIATIYDNLDIFDTAVKTDIFIGAEPEDKTEYLKSYLLDWNIVPDGAEKWLVNGFSVDTKGTDFRRNGAEWIILRNNPAVEPPYLDWKDTCSITRIGEDRYEFKTKKVRSYIDGVYNFGDADLVFELTRTDEQFTYEITVSGGGSYYVLESRQEEELNTATRGEKHYRYTVEDAVTLTRIYGSEFRFRSGRINIGMTDDSSGDTPQSLSVRIGQTNNLVNPTLRITYKGYTYSFS